MPDVRPFTAVTYDPARAGPLAKLVAEPYDKVTEAMREAYLRGAPYSVVRVDLPREEVDGKDRYATAAATFRGWLAKGVVRKAARPAFYLYEQGFAIPGAPRLVRRAIVGLVEAREHAPGHVLPHERTFREPKADRMALLEAVRAHFGMCFLLYDDPDREVARAAAIGDVPSAVPVADFELPDGTSHRVTPIEDPAACAAIRRALAAKTGTIADGHHRYETAIAFRRGHEKRGDCKPGYAYRTAAFVDVADPGLKILPTHRLLPKDVTARRFAEASARWLVPLAAPPADRQPAFMVYEGGAYALFDVRPDLDLAAELPDVPEAVRRLDVTILHKLVLERGLGIESGAKEHALGYVRWPDEGKKKLEAGGGGVLVLLRATSAADVLAVAASGAVMPQKSTDFYPKLLSGLILNDIEDPLHG